MNVTGWWAARLPFGKTRVEADFGDLEQFAVVEQAAEANLLGIGIRIVDTEPNVDLRLGSIHDEPPQRELGSGMMTFAP